MIPIAKWLQLDRFDPLLSGEPDLPPASGNLQIQSDTEERCIAAFRKGEQYAQEVAEETYKSLIAAVKVEAEAEREAARRDWQNSSAVDIATTMASHLKKLRQEIEENLIAILTPFLCEATQKSAMSAFSSLLETHIQARTSAIMKLSVPVELQAEMAHQFAQNGITVEILPSPDGEFRADMAGGGFESRLKEWLAAIEFRHE